MADNQDTVKERYLAGYAQGLSRGNEPPILGDIQLMLDNAIGEGHESSRKGLQQGFDEMRAAKKAESKKSKKSMKKGGLAKSASKRADGIAIKGKTKGRMI